MSKEFTDLIKPLGSHDVELRESNINKGGYVLILAYKTARADVARLNEVFGLLWKNRHFQDEKQRLCCGISIYSEKISKWVERIDVGSESQYEKDKGNYSDSFKRAGFKWGIGIELYKMPTIKIKLKNNEYETKFNAKANRELTNTTWDCNISSWTIDYKVEDGIPCNVVVKDDSGEVRFSTDKDVKVSSKPDTTQKQQTTPKKENEVEKTDTTKLVESLLKVAKFKGYTKEDVEKKINVELYKASSELIQKAVDYYAKGETKGIRCRNALIKKSGKSVIEINKVSQAKFELNFTSLTEDQMEAVKEAL